MALNPKLRGNQVSCVLLRLRHFVWRTRHAQWTPMMNPNLQSPSAARMKFQGAKMCKARNQANPQRFSQLMTENILEYLLSLLSSISSLTTIYNRTTPLPSSQRHAPAEVPPLNLLEEHRENHRRSRGFDVKATLN